MDRETGRAALARACLRFPGGLICSSVARCLSERSRRHSVTELPPSHGLSAPHRQLPALPPCTTIFTHPWDKSSSMRANYESLYSIPFPSLETKMKRIPSCPQIRHHPMSHCTHPTGLELKLTNFANSHANRNSLPASPVFHGRHSPTSGLTDLESRVLLPCSLPSALDTLAWGMSPLRVD